MKKILVLFNYSLFCILVLPAIARADGEDPNGVLPPFTGDLDNAPTLVVDMVRYIIKDFDYTAAFYDVMCWLSLFITAALGIKQLFIKTDEDRGGGFWNVLKIAGWGIAGLLGIIIKNSM